MSDSPCKSPDCPADSDLISWGVIGSSSKLNPLRGARFLGDCTVFVLTVFFGRATTREAGFFRSTFFAVFFLGVAFFAGRFFATAFRAGLRFLAEVRFSLAVFFLDPLLAAITAVYHRHNQALKTLRTRDASARPQPFTERSSGMELQSILRWVAQPFAIEERVGHPGQSYALRLPTKTPPYCFVATYVDVRPVSLLLSTTVIVFPSDPTVIFDTSVTVPSRLSVSSMAWSLMRFSETEFQP